MIDESPSRRRLGRATIAVVFMILAFTVTATLAQSPTSIGRQVRLTREGVGCSEYNHTLQILSDSFAYGNAHTWLQPNSANAAAAAKRAFFRQIGEHHCIFILPGSTVTISHPFGPTYAIAGVRFNGRNYWVGFPWEILGDGPELPPSMPRAP